MTLGTDAPRRIKRPTDKQIDLASDFLAAEVVCSDDEEAEAIKAVARWLRQQLVAKKRKQETHK